MKANKEHYALALKDFQDRDFENILKRPVHCEREGHEKEELKFFCKNCEVAICFSCVATLHEGHAKTLLDEAANERKLLVNAAIDSRKQKVLQKRNIIAQLQSNCVNIQSQVESVKRDAQRFADDMIAVIEAKKQEIFNDVEKKANELLERLGIQQSEVEHQVKLINRVSPLRMRRKKSNRSYTLMSKFFFLELLLLDFLLSDLHYNIARFSDAFLL